MVGERRYLSQAKQPLIRGHKGQFEYFHSGNQETVRRIRVRKRQLRREADVVMTSTGEVKHYLKCPVIRLIKS